METIGGTPDHNSLGKAAFIIGLIGLILSFVPIIGFVSWLLAPLAILCGLVALRKPPRSLAIAGLITGGLALLICIWWLNATKSMGEAMSADTFNTTGEAQDHSNAPIVQATIGGVWDDMEENKVAAGSKYGGSRLRFTDEAINEIQGDAQNPSLVFVGKTEEYLMHMVSASFASGDSEKIATRKKGDKVTFVCQNVKENIGGGYSLSGCILE